MRLMAKVFNAIYEDGVLKPVENPGLQEHEKVRIEIREAPERKVHSTLAEWAKVYEGLSDQEIDEIDEIIRDRSNFSRRDPE